MDCQEIRKLLLPFLESDLPEADRTKVEAHLLVCGDCQKEKVLYEKTWAMLGSFKAPEVSRDFTADLMTKISEEKRGKIEPEVTFPEIALPVLASILVSVLFCIGGFFFFQHQQIKELPMSEPVRVIVSARVKETFPPVSIIHPKGDFKVAVKRAVSDDEIIRNLDAYENIEFYQNLPVLKDLDVVQNLGSKGLPL